MKPLELTVYPRVARRMPESIRDDAGWDTYYDGLEELRQQYLRQQAKRLTEAELCAEYESARCDAMVVLNTGRCWSSPYHSWPMDKRSTLNRASTLLRFALTPHYFEEAA